MDCTTGGSGSDLTRATASGADRAASVSATSARHDPLTIIVPVYNEADNFPALLAEVERHIPQPFTLLVVYDFEEDTTVPVARAMACDRPWLRLHKNTLGRGVVYALRAGFEAVACGPVLVVMAGLSDDLRAAPKMLQRER